MKITVIFLFVAFATLVQFQVSAAQEEEKEEESPSLSSVAKGSEESLALIRRKRFAWFSFIDAFWKFFSVGSKTGGVKQKPISDNSESAKSVAKHSKKPFNAHKAGKKERMEFNKTVNDIHKNMDKKSKPVRDTLRNFTRDIMIQSKMKLLGDVVFLISKVCNETLVSINPEVKKTDVKYKLEIIDRMINRNLNESNPFKLIMEKDYPNCQLVHFSTKGFECNNEFCERFGDGLHAFGICSPYACSCSESGAEGLKCPDKFVYNPLRPGCNDPEKDRMCGFFEMK